MPLDNHGRSSGVEKSISADYYVLVSRNSGATPWQWEIQRRSRPLGVRLYGAGFVSQAGARLAGETALKALLREIAKNSERERR
jgi:hypothetical protein